MNHQLINIVVVDAFISDNILPQHIQHSSQGSKFTIEITHENEIHDVKITYVNQIDRTEGEIPIIRIVSQTTYRVVSSNDLFKKGNNDNLVNIILGMSSHAEAHNIGMMVLKAKGTLLEKSPIHPMPLNMKTMAIMTQINYLFLN